jgi:2-dehydro-3-deoxyglucarate aldolase
MERPVTHIKAALQQGTPSIGSWMQIPSTSVAEIMGQAGYDWVAVDLEHGNFSCETMPDIFRALELGGTIPLARVAQCHPKDIKQALDAGAQGVILPMVESKEQLEDAISWSFYPPRGRRGVGYSRANGFGKNFDFYVQNKAEDLLIVAQIEHIKVIQNLEDILSVKFLDAIMVGPYDLSGSMNLTAQFQHPDFLNAMYTISYKAKQYNIPMGTHIVQPDKVHLQAKLSEGYRIID